MIYHHYGWDLAELARNRTDNPLSTDSAEVRILAHPIIGNATNPVIQDFVESLGLDASQWSNYEPAFVESLRNQNPLEYRAVELLSEWSEYDRLFADAFVHGGFGAHHRGFFGENE